MSDPAGSPAATAASENENNARNRPPTALRRVNIKTLRSWIGEFGFRISLDNNINGMRPATIREAELRTWRSQAELGNERFSQILNPKSAIRNFIAVPQSASSSVPAASFPEALPAL